MSTVPPDPRRLSRPSLPLLLFLATAAGTSTGCTDNVACVFTDGCRDGEGPISENEALAPLEGEWIVDGPPRLDPVRPSGTQNPGTTPIVLSFSETMQEPSLQGAIEIVPVTNGMPGQPVAGLSQVLVSDGRVLVLVPGATPLAAGEYEVRLAQGAAPLDLTGQAFAPDEDAPLGRFTVAATPSSAPRIVASFPADGARNQSATTEIVVVFDRGLRAASVTPASFDVRVGDPPVDPPEDPPATALTVPGRGPDTRIYVYRSVDDELQPVPLGTDVPVEVRLSSLIEDEDGDDLTADTLTFRTLAFAPPESASLTSEPHDAIGLDNLNDVRPLMVTVELLDARSGDFVDLFLFGTMRDAAPPAPLIALFRPKRFDGTAPLTFQRDDVGLEGPAGPLCEDGPVTFAFRVRRGSVVTPLRLLDLDPDPATIQDPLLDTVRPAVQALVGSSGTSSFRSDQRGLSLAGSARDAELLRSVEVMTFDQAGLPLVDNGPLAPVVGSQGGLFLAAPVDLGLGQQSAQGTSFSFVAYDQGLNGAPELSGTYTQLGAVGPDPLGPGDEVEIEVFDARTLELLVGTLVLVHSDEPGFPLTISGTTQADGRVRLRTASAPSLGAIVTVVHAGYDLFTLHGVPSTHLSVPLRQSKLADADATGRVLSRALEVAGLNLRIDDSRRPAALPRGFEGGACDDEDEDGQLECPYGPESVRAGPLGARSLFAGDFSPAVFDPAVLLQAFAILVPLGPTLPSAAQAGDILVPALLPLAAADPDRAQEVPPFDFRVEAGSGVDLLRLKDEMSTTGTPFVTVEALVHGLSGAIAVAQGIALDCNPPAAECWTIRAAMPGALTPGGSLGADVVDTDLFVRVEVVDLDENAAGARPRLSALQGAAPAFRALAVPTQLVPNVGDPSGGQAFSLFLRHAIEDGREPGLYRVELEDVDERRWTLWRFDPPGSADVELRVVDVGAAGGLGLADGELESVVSAYAWSTLDPLDFLWSDVEREFELFSRAAPLRFTKP